MVITGTPIGWFDWLVILVLLFGIVRGRKRGISEELLDVIKWVLIVSAGAFLYEPLGAFLVEMTFTSRVACYLAAYTSVMVCLFLLFSFIRRQVGDKLVSSDAFGNGEYYLGMMAGTVRYACILLAAMALLNARYYSAAEVATLNNFQENNFGSIRFPTICSLQSEVFEQSTAGNLARQYLPLLLIQATPPENTDLRNRGIVRGRERMVNEVLDKK